MLFGYILRKLRFLGRSLKNLGNEEDSTQNENSDKLSGSLKKNLKALQATLVHSTDIKVHSLRFGQNNAYSGAFVFIDGLVDNLIITESILRPIKEWHAGDEAESENNLIDILEKEVFCAATAKNVKTMPELAAGCLGGDTVLLVDGFTSALILDTKGWDKRNITEPQSETVVRGPREGFTEDLRTNTSLIRRKIRNEKLKIELLTVGRKTQTGVCLIYLDGVANPSVVETVKQRIEKLDVESILESGYIEEYIEDAPFSPFATIGYSEKPDVVASKVLEGRVAIAIDGTPFVLTAPMLFIESFQTAEDYYNRPLYSSLVRIIRYIAYIITIFAPAIYVAVSSFHHELIPTTLLFTVAKAREGTPFPIYVEALIMIFAFELLREAGVRLPRPVGQAISIVGALIMGDAAVSAGIVGAPMVIVIAVTAVAGFLVPSQNDSASILRVAVMVPAAIVGFYGVGLTCLGMLIHLATLKSFGVPYFDSFGYAKDAQDALVRMPLWSMRKRPEGVAQGDTTRIKPFIPPLRPHDSDVNGSEP